MPIQISQHLTASPNPTTLPKRIELQQTLRSQLASESITVVYGLELSHDVYFKDGDDAPAKSFTRTETVGRTDKVCIDRVSLVRGPGTGPMNLVEVQQRITDSLGIVITDLVVIQLS
jgi:hypothetical protein